MRTPSVLARLAPFSAGRLAGRALLLAGGLLAGSALALPAPSAVAALAPREDLSEPRSMSVVEWLNHEVRQSELVLTGEVLKDAYPHPQTGKVTTRLRVGEVFSGPKKLGYEVGVALRSGTRGGKPTMPAPLLKGQWVLLFLRNEGGAWVAPPVGRVVETPFKGLTFFPSYNIVLEDAAPGMSWDYVLKSLNHIVQTRQQTINGYLPKLRQARSKEDRDRLNLAIEWDVRERLGLSVP